MIDEYSDSPPSSAAFDIDRIEALLQAAARDRRDISYSEMLLNLGMRFSRPKMRALCRVLDEVDRRAEARGEPALAPLVVRESDRLPGQGWWIGQLDYIGEWTGPEARAYLREIQDGIFGHWAARE
jgi:hypothetical protein